MSEVEKILQLMEKMVGTPLYLLVCIGTLIFFVYYFWKVAPARYEAFENLVKDNTEQRINGEKLTEQYERALENSNRVIENNTAALKSNQAMLELFNSKIDTNTEKINECIVSAKDFNDKVDDMHLSVVKIDAKLEQLTK